MIAVLADIHGNRWALEAVLADAERAGARQFVDLGDCVAGPLDPSGTAQRLMELGAMTVRGNNDRAVLMGRPGRSAAFAHDELDEAQSAWLANLPTTALVADGVLACHGSPSDDTCYLLEEVTQDGARRRDPADVRELLGDVSAPVVLCGHTHLPRLLGLGDGTVILNPGSVGLPAYDDDMPDPHVMESGSPHARYALLEPCRDGWDVQLRTVTYPWNVAAEVAGSRGFEDWAVALETGLALPTIARGRRSDHV